jgi:CCR4-NOT transcriptional regulation complex NOT5 subunit
LFLEDPAEQTRKYGDKLSDCFPRAQLKYDERELFNRAIAELEQQESAYAAPRTGMQIANIEETRHSANFAEQIERALDNGSMVPEGLEEWSDMNAVERRQIRDNLKTLGQQRAIAKGKGKSKGIS